MKDRKSMKIVYCITGTYNSAGMERVLANKANWLSRNGYEVIIVTTDQNGRKPFYPIDKEIRCYDLDINYFKSGEESLISKLIHFPIRRLKHKHRLYGLLEKLKADIVISMFLNDAYLVCSAKDGSRKILEFHFSKYMTLRYGQKGLRAFIRKMINPAELKMVSRFNRFVLLTKEDGFYWGELFNKVVIPNACTFQTEKCSELQHKKVLAVGRLKFQKGFDILIDIWNKIVESMPDWHLDIVGDGELHGELQDKINAYGIGEQISLIGADKDIEKHYLDASIVVVTSRFEGFSMALVESQAFGLPVVSFDCKCGPSDIITDGQNGYLIPEGDNKLFVNRLIMLMKDSELREKMGKEAKLASSKLSESSVMKQWTALFDSVVKE
jgi:glycosyltransferase involved in cell wall biosynthesis